MAARAWRQGMLVAQVAAGWHARASLPTAPWLPARCHLPAATGAQCRTVPPQLPEVPAARTSAAPLTLASALGPAACPATPGRAAGGGGALAPRGRQRRQPLHAAHDRGGAALAGGELLISRLMLRRRRVGEGGRARRRRRLQGSCRPERRQASSPACEETHAAACGWPLPTYAAHIAVARLFPASAILCKVASHAGPRGRQGPRAGQGQRRAIQLRVVRLSLRGSSRCVEPRGSLSRGTAVAYSLRISAFRPEATSN